MPEPTDMIMPMLREMRDETRQGFDDMRSRLDGLDERLRAVERLVKVQREAFEGESILGRYAARHDSRNQHPPSLLTRRTTF
jgi:hypothetical protein